MSSLKKILDAIDVIHSDCFMFVSHHGPGMVGYFQAIATRQDDGTWKLERKTESQSYSVATGKDLKPPEIMDFDTMLSEMDAFSAMYHELNTVNPPARGTHFETVKTLIKSNTAGRLKAVQKLRRSNIARRGPGPN